MLPPMVPWFRICGEAASSDASTSRLNWLATSECRITSRSVAIAPISTVPPNDRIDLSDSIPARSTTAAGFFTRSLNQSQLSSPPASTQASAPY